MNILRNLIEMENIQTIPPPAQEQALNTKAASKPAPKPLLSDRGSAYDYQRRDAEIIDYNIWKLWTPQAGFAIRGPRPASLTPGTFCTAIGAAFTFGRFAPKPYPALLGEALGLSSLNLGFAGIGPAFFNHPKNRALLNLINRSKFVTISVMSGRSQSNSRFKAEDYSQVQYKLASGKVVPADFAYQQLLEEADEATVANLVAETRERYLEEFIQLLNNITVPKILLWFSKRSPDYTESYDSLFKLFGSFPHLVNRPMIETLKPHCNAYVECVSTAGLPQTLTNRQTGESVSITRPRTYQNGKVYLTASSLSKNSYYPSPKMHGEAVKYLLPVCQQLSI